MERDAPCVADDDGADLQELEADGAALGAGHVGALERQPADRLDHGAKGANPRYVVTNLDGAGQELYDTLYCQRGEMENRIKEQQLNLFADRTSCHDWWPTG